MTRPWSGAGLQRILRQKDGFEVVAECCDGREVPAVEELTARELEVVQLIGRGATNTEIADALFVSEGTVKTHVGRVVAKLGPRDRAAAIVWAFDHGLVNPRS